MTHTHASEKQATDFENRVQKRMQPIAQPPCRGVVAIIYLAERMASAEREPITGVWGQSPQRGPGAQPLLGGKGAKPP